MLRIIQAAVTKSPTIAIRSSSRLAETILDSRMRQQQQHNAIDPRFTSIRHFSSEEPAMFCRQCEQTQDGVACTVVGVCGKSPRTSFAQDALIEVIKCISLWAVAARKAGATAEEMNLADIYALKAAFSTVTNVNFSETRIAEYVEEGMAVKKQLQDLVQSKKGEAPTGETAELELPSGMTPKELEDFGKSVGVLARQKKMGNDDAFSLNELGTYGLKGVSAYAMHANQLGRRDEDNIMAPVHEIWAKLASNEPDVDGLLANALRVGEVNMATMALLDQTHADVLGEPVPTEVRQTAVEGKAILVSGHDMVDLLELLKQTEGKNINVFTHGEMLPAHMYPELHKFKHLAGNYGTAWQAQKIEFATFPGPIIMTTNCVLEPRKAYRDRLFTLNEVGVDGVQHIKDRDFSQVIEKAQAMQGFKKTIEPARFHTVGFNHRVVLPLANQVIEAAQSGALSRIFVIGGCDGSEWDRSYYTDLAEATPEDSLILTLGCAKNRVIHSKKLKGQTLANGLPRILDMGQCNDAYSALVVASELAKALNCSVNDLPLSLAISHLEQKAAAVLLSMLHLGVKNIRLGPRMPAYITPNVLKVIQDNYNLMPLGNMEDDLKLMMQGK